MFNQSRYGMDKFDNSAIANSSLNQTSYIDKQNLFHKQKQREGSLQTLNQSHFPMQFNNQNQTLVGFMTPEGANKNLN